MTQLEKIEHHLKTYGEITSIEAIMKYGITRISAHILTLRKAGYNIETYYPKGVQYAIYKLINRNQQGVLL